MDEGIKDSLISSKKIRSEILYSTSIAEVALECLKELINYEGIAILLNSKTTLEDLVEIYFSITDHGLIETERIIEEFGPNGFKCEDFHKLKEVMKE